MRQNIQVLHAPGRLVAIVGFSARAAVQSATRAGLRAIGIDECSDRDLLASCHDSHSWLNDWLEWLATKYPGATLVLAGGMEHRLECLDRCTSYGIHCSTSSSQVQQLRSLDNWKRWSSQAGIGFPNTRTSKDFEDSTVAFLPKDASSQWLIKSTGSVGGTAIRKLHKENLQPTNAIRLKPSEYVQQMVEGASIGVTFLSSELGSIVVGATKSIGQNTQLFLTPFVYRGSWGPIPIPRQNVDALGRFATLVHDEVGMRGLWQADFVVAHSKWHLLEINPRWTASMEILDASFNISLVSIHLECATHTMDESRWESIRKRLEVNHQQTSLSMEETKGVSSMFGKLVFFAEEPCEVSEVQSNRWWSKRWLGTVQELQIPKMEFDGQMAYRFADIPRSGVRIESRQPIMTVYANNEEYLCALASSNSWK